MAYPYEYDAPDVSLASYAAADARAAFIRRTYLHLAGAILAFVGLQFLLFKAVPQQTLESVMGTMFRSPVSMLFVLAVFIGVGYLARYWASSDTSRGVQYLGLGLYVVLEAVIMLPMIYFAVYRMAHDPSILPNAAILTLCVFGGLTMAAFITKKDFSFLGPILSIACFLMLGVAIIAIIFPQNLGLGLWWSFLGVGLASAMILYDTSNVIHHFRTDQDVAAALSLFASVAYLFYHILRILIMMSSNRSN